MCALCDASLNTANKPSEHQSVQPNVKVEEPPRTQEVNTTADVTGQGSPDERSHERQLTFIRTTRMGPGLRLSTVVGEIEYRAEMSVEGL